MILIQIMIMIISPKIFYISLLKIIIQRMVIILIINNNILLIILILDDNLSKSMQNITEKHTINMVNTNNPIDISKEPITSMNNNVTSNTYSITNFNNISINSNNYDLILFRFT